MSSERTSWKPDEADDPSEGEDAPEIGLEQTILDELGEMRAITLRFARRLDAKADTEEGRKDLPRLNNAAVKAARALRQIAVLQLEIAGMRPLPNQRGPNLGGSNVTGPNRGEAAGAAANRNKPATASIDRWYPEGYPFTHGDYTDYDEYTDYERDLLERAKLNARLEGMEAALDEDFRAAGREDICRQSPETKSRLVFSIPHPALDRWVAEAEAEIVHAVFGFENVLPLKLGTGPPGELEAYDAKRKAFLPPDPS